jgi:spore germination protein GerM
MKRGLVIGMIFLFILAGCGSKVIDNDPTTVPSPSTSQGSENTSTKPEETQTISVITAYYSNPDLTELVSHEQSITYKDDSQMYQETFKQLTESPGEGLEPLWAGFLLNEIRLDAGTLIVDVTFDPESILGSGGELFALEALQNTFFQYDNVERIQILVDGEITESLMGHVEISEPFERP